MSKENSYHIPRNTFDMQAVKDNIANLKCKHDEIVDTVKNCIGRYDRYCDTQKNLLRSKLPELVFGNCKHLDVEWDKNRYEECSKGFWICICCNEIMRRNNWVTDFNRGWVTRGEEKIIDKILIAFFEEYPDIDTDICNNDRMRGI
jgi:hypothetical protein